jgi:hypothetical protein
MTDATVSATGCVPGDAEKRREAVRLLDRAAELIVDGWCQGSPARDEHGRQVEPWSGRAYRWSALGALAAAWFESRGTFEGFLSAHRSLSVATGGHLDEWNDRRWRTKRHVLSAFGRARAWLPESERHVPANSVRRHITALNDDRGDIDASSLDNVRDPTR